MIWAMTEEYNPNSRKKIIVGLALLTAWIIMTIIPTVFKDKTGRLFDDPYDRNDYFERGKWFTENTLPLSEYPQIPTLLFGINHLTSMWGNSNMQLTLYVAFFSLEMLLVLFLVYKVLLKLLPAGFSNYALLVLLPPTLYFTYNRFDILPAYLCLIAYSAATKREWMMVSIILSIATFTKWYPILLFPGFFMYAVNRESKFQWNMILGFTMTSSAIVLLSYLYGGLATVLAPYQFHLARGLEYTALPVLIHNMIRGLLGIQINLPLFFLFFFIAQVSGPILIFLVKLDSLNALIDYSIVVIGLFMLFSRIWSPQWFLWLIPFLIISAKNLKTVGLIIVYNLATYLSFPLISDYYGSNSYQFYFSGLLTYVILLVIILRSVMNLKQASILTRLKTDQVYLPDLAYTPAQYARAAQPDPSLRRAPRS